jgi:quercetin dioxygenase-like cupin family protein
MKTANLTRPELEKRIARFDKLQPMSTAKDLASVPPAAYDIVFARKLMPVVLEKTESPFGTVAPIYGAAGLSMWISVCPPGQGPALHSHDKTYETFTVLEGAFEFSINDTGNETVVLQKWDTLSCPPGVCRGFRNVSDKDSVLLTVITGAVHDRDDVSLPPSVAEELNTIGPGISAAFEKIGLRFDAGVNEADAP